MDILSHVLLKVHKWVERVVSLAVIFRSFFAKWCNDFCLENEKHSSGAFLQLWRYPCCVAAHVLSDLLGVQFCSPLSKLQGHTFIYEIKKETAARTHHRGLLRIAWWCRMDPARLEPLTSAPPKKKKGSTQKQTLTSKKSNKQVKVVTFWNARQLNSKSRLWSACKMPKFCINSWDERSKIDLSYCILVWLRLPEEKCWFVDWVHVSSKHKPSQGKTQLPYQMSHKKVGKMVLPSRTSPHFSSPVWNLILSQFTTIYSFSFPCFLKRSFIFFLL